MFLLLNKFTFITLVIFVANICTFDFANSCKPIYVRWPRVRLNVQPTSEGTFSFTSCKGACTNEENPMRQGISQQCSSFNHRVGPNQYSSHCQIFQKDKTQILDGYVEADDRYSFYWKYCVKSDRVCSGEYAFTFLSDRYMASSEITKKFDSSTLEECLAECLNENSYLCRSVSFNRTSGECGLSKQNQLSKPAMIKLNNNPNFRVDYYENNCFNISESFAFDYRCEENGIRVKVDSILPYTGALYGLYDFFTCRVEPKEETKFEYLFEYPTVSKNCSDSLRFKGKEMILEVVLSTDGVEPLYFITPDDLTFQAKCPINPTMGLEDNGDISEFPDSSEDINSVKTNSLLTKNTNSYTATEKVATTTPKASTFTKPTLTVFKKNTVKGSSIKATTNMPTPAMLITASDRLLNRSFNNEIESSGQENIETETEEVESSGQNKVGISNKLSINYTKKGLHLVNALDSTSLKQTTFNRNHWRDPNFVGMVPIYRQTTIYPIQKNFDDLSAKSASSQYENKVPPTKPMRNLERTTIASKVDKTTSTSQIDETTNSPQKADKTIAPEIEKTTGPPQMYLITAAPFIDLITKVKLIPTPIDLTTNNPILITTDLLETAETPSSKFVLFGFFASLVHALIIFILLICVIFSISGHISFPSRNTIALTSKSRNVVDKDIPVSVQTKTHEILTTLPTLTTKVVTTPIVTATAASAPITTTKVTTTTQKVNPTTATVSIESTIPEGIDEDIVSTAPTTLELLTKRVEEQNKPTTNPPTTPNYNLEPQRNVTEYIKPKIETKVDISDMVKNAVLKDKVIFEIYHNSRPVEAVVVGSRITLSFTPTLAVPPSYMSITGCQVEPIGSLYDWEKEPLAIIKDGCQADHVGLVCPPQKTDYGVRVTVESFRYQTTAQVQYTCLIRICPFSECPTQTCNAVEGCPRTESPDSITNIFKTRAKRLLSIDQIRQAVAANPYLLEQLNLTNNTLSTPSSNHLNTVLQQQLVAIAGDHVVRKRLVVVNSEEELKYYVKTGDVPELGN